MARSFLRYNTLRLVVALVVLAWVLAELWRGETATLPVVEALGVALAVVLVVLFGVRGREVSRPFQLFQLALDVLLVSVLSVLSGGLHSFFTLLYFPAIGAGAYLQRRAGALWTASFASAAFVGLLEMSGSFVATDREQLVVLFSEVMFRIFAFYLMAVLTGQLAAQLARAGEALREERASSILLASEHDTVLEQVRAGVLSSDREGRITGINPFGRALFGDVRGRPIDEVLPRARESDTWEERREEQRWVCSRGSLPDGGWVIVVEDVTELARMREAALRDERMVEAGRMAAGLAHEVRNPLASLSGSLQLIREEHPSRLADLALEEAERLNRLVEDFLAAARRPSIAPRTVDVLSLARGVCEAFEQDRRYANRVHARQEGVPSVAEVDPDRVRQALWNLVLNGAQAMPRGGTVTVRVEPAAHGDREGVSLLVADEGEGISDADRSRLFNPFFTTRSGGTGLGLLLVEQVARGHGGYVRVERGDPRGTLFTLWLPREASRGA